MQYLRRKQVAARLGIDPRTVDLWRKRGKIPAPSIMNSIPVWDSEELEAWLKAKKEVRT
jgi:predicted DNA-binding transcriptional regulator AlpA